ncbi:hypothetical protein JCM17960_13910 [Magnetospira thiophila]
MAVKVLDCTFRDGGYYNDWDFSPEVVQLYLLAMAAAKVDVVELGFRFSAQNIFLGAHAYTTDAYLSKLDLPESLKIAVMINATDVIKAPKGAITAIDHLFGTADRSPVSMVRVAAHLNQVADCRAAVGRLKELGYEVGFNLMQVSSQPPEKLTALAKEVASWHTVEVLYFADSLGNMNEADVAAVAQALAAGWDGELGVHSHDNMSRAFSNSLAALEAGVTWLDGTVYGMGRGAGNVRTEYLLVELKRRGIAPYDPDPLFPLVLMEFKALHDQYGWGPNLLYFLSAAYLIHPTYVQEMLRVENHSAEHAVAALEALRQNGGMSYSAERLQQAMGGGVVFPGTWNARGWAAGRKILIIGSGSWIKRHEQFVLEYIERTKPLVLCLNVRSPVPSGHVDAYVACHSVRFALEGRHYLSLEAPLIAPAKALPKELAQKMTQESLHDWGMTVKSGLFEVHETHCTIPQRLAAAYALALANAAGATAIELAGFDGYGPEDPRQAEMQRVFAAYHAHAALVPVTAITPSTYDVRKSSLFAP